MQRVNNKKIQSKCTYCEPSHGFLLRERIGIKINLKRTISSYTLKCISSPYSFLFLSTKCLLIFFFKQMFIHTTNSQFYFLIHLDRIFYKKPRLYLINNKLLSFHLLFWNFNITKKNYSWVLFNFQKYSKKNWVQKIKIKNTQNVKLRNNPFSNKTPATIYTEHPSDNNNYSIN